MMSQLRERSFSAIMMADIGINHLIVLHMHGDKTDALDIHVIAREFASVMKYNYTFCMILKLVLSYSLIYVMMSTENYTQQ